MNIIKEIKQIFRTPSVQELYAEDVEKVSNETSEFITPMVLNGEMYLAYKGVPLIKESDLKKGIVEAVEDARLNAGSYVLTKQKKKYGID